MDQKPTLKDAAVNRLLINCRGMAEAEAEEKAEAALAEAITLSRWLPSILKRIETEWYGRKQKGYEPR